MREDSPRWEQINASSYPWEQDGLRADRPQGVPLTSPASQSLWPANDWIEAVGVG
ncbi:hypothetical protein AB0H57_09500 [Micromonospora sp. NPDC050686]|uniref:hypothetical protein n=1 Tax=Micromonospora sp. NPDC050686 TaxID=3154631 RepID=UPI0033C7832D